MRVRARYLIETGLVHYTYNCALLIILILGWARQELGFGHIKQTKQATYLLLCR